MVEEKIENTKQTQPLIETAQLQDDVQNEQPAADQSLPTQVIVQSRKPLYLAALAIFIAVIVFLAIFFGPRLFRQATPTNLITPVATFTANPVATAPASTKSASILTQNCTNNFYKYSIEYPITWFTTQRAEKERCWYFNPTVFSFPKSWDGPLTPISIRSVALAEWETTKIKAASSSASEKILEIINLKIDNNLAQRIESKFRGEGLFEEGAVSVVYLIDHPKTPLIVQFQTTKANDLNSKDYIKILDELVKSLKFL